MINIAGNVENTNLRKENVKVVLMHFEFISPTCFTNSPHESGWDKVTETLPNRGLYNLNHF